VALDRAVHLAEEERCLPGVVPGRLAGVVGFVPGAELADAERAEVVDDAPDLPPVGRNRRKPCLLDSVVVRRHVQQHIHVRRARALEVRARGQSLRRIVHEVPRHEEAHPLEARALERALVEHRDALIPDADADRDAGGRARRRRQDDGGHRGRGWEDSHDLRSVDRVGARARARADRPIATCR
jgi:hypothetical protein